MGVYWHILYTRKLRKLIQNKIGETKKKTEQRAKGTTIFRFLLNGKLAYLLYMA